MSMSAADYRAQASKPKRHKFNAKKVTIDGITFDSTKEGNRYLYLKARQAAGEISHLELQPKFKFAIGARKVTYDSGRQVTYRADFTYFDGQHRVIEDVKGFRTKEYKLKKAFVQAIFPAVRIVEV